MFRRPTLDENNRLFTALVVCWGGVLGSAITVLFVGAIFAAFLRLYQRKILIPVQHRVRAIAVAFAFYFLAHAISAVVNFKGWATLSEIVEVLPFLGFLFVYGRLSLSSRQDILRSVEFGAVCGAIATFVFVLFEVFFAGQKRAEALAGNPGVLAVICSVLYGLCILTFVRNRGNLRWIALIAAFCAAVTVLLTGMRALWPFLLIGPFVVLAILRPRLDWRLLRVAGVVGAIPALAAILLTYQLVEKRLERLAVDIEKVEVGDYDSSVGKRLVMWDNGLELAAEKPLFGSGPVPPDSTSIGYSHFHNFLLDALVKSGIVGVLATFGLFFVPLWAVFGRRRDDVALSGIVMLVIIQGAMLLSGTVGIMLGHDLHDTLFIYGTIVATFLVLGGEAPISVSSRQPGSETQSRPEHIQL